MEISKSLAYWFRQKFNLTPHDPLFLSMTPEEIETEYWADNYYRNPPSESMSSDDYDVEAIDEMMANGDWEDILNV